MLECTKYFIFIKFDLLFILNNKKILLIITPEINASYNLTFLRIKYFTQSYKSSPKEIKNMK